MAQQQQRRSFYLTPTHVAPITCPHCGANAHLMRRTPHAELKGELRTFECIVCSNRTEMTVRD